MTRRAWRSTEPRRMNVSLYKGVSEQVGMSHTFNDIRGFRLLSVDHDRISP